MNHTGGDRGPDRYIRRPINRQGIESGTTRSSADVLAEESDGALPCHAGAVRVVVRPLVAVEAVPGGIDVDRHLGMRRGARLDVAHRDRPEERRVGKEGVSTGRYRW